MKKSAPKMDYPRLWLRIGENSNYQDCGNDFDMIALILFDANIEEILGWTDGGFQAPGYGVANYVSLFYGDSEGNYHSDLDEVDRKDLINALAREWEYYSEKQSRLRQNRR